MKPMVGVGVFGKQDMIGWMLEGIVNCFPKGTHVVFFFEACTDQSLPNFLELAPKMLQDYPWSYGQSATHVLEHGVHNWLIDEFMKTDCDLLVVPHDDNKFLGTSVLADIEKVIVTFGDSLGWISARDGYEASYRNMVSSPFSASNGGTMTKLPVGEFAAKSQMNTGPVVYTRKLVKKIGKPDMAYEGWYWWDDYALKAKHAGLQNVLLSMDCLHCKFGSIQNNHALFDSALVARDLKRLADRWTPIFGNPI
jgi:hypothetical protein